MDNLNIKVHTFGCKVNTYDSGLIQKSFNAQESKNLLEIKSDRSGIANSQVVQTQTQVHIINSCAVTAEATKEAIRYVRRLKAKDPFSTIVVTGKFSELPGVDIVVANSHKTEIPIILKKHFSGTLNEKVFKSNIFRKEDLGTGGGVEQKHTRSFLKIQDGCNSFCSYCIIPYARGKSRSIPIKELTQKIIDLSASGVSEVVLTGVHIGDYVDQNLRLEDLIEALLIKTQNVRFRLSSLEPVEVSDRLLDFYSDSRMCPHFHMSIQSANTKVLKDMKRNYSQEDVIESLNTISERIKNAFVGMDVIVGFPTESDDDFMDTYKVLNEAPWSKIHVFPYSEREGTRAAELMEQIKWETRKERAHKLRELSLSRFDQMAKKQIGMNKNILIQNKKTRGAHGVSEDYWSVKINEFDSFQERYAGKIVPVQIVGYETSSNFMDGILVAEIGI